MTKKMLINAVDPEESRMAIVEDGVLAELIIETSLQELSRGNIYKGKIVNIEPSLQAVFVDYGEARHGFLPFSEIHPDYYANNSQDAQKGGRPRIQEVIKRNQEVLVQIEKEETGTKGAALTTYISLPGRYLVLMPGSDGGGISRKIEDEKERRKIKEIVQQLEVPAGMGLIVRTAGLEKNKSELAKDMHYLLRLWESILAKSKKIPAPSIIYQERDLVIRSIRDYFTPDLNEVLIDNKEFFNRARDFFRVVMPRYQNKVKLYGEKRPLFSKYELEKQLETVYERKVPLKSGGSIVIDPAEALVAVDVNSGRATQGKGMEETAFQTNLEAAEEIARQLRLRDLGGLVVIDFIDMWDRKHKQEVERSLRNALKRDKARVETGRISRFGLLELSRQRIRPAVSERSFISCANCSGSGLVKSTEAAALTILRRVQAGLAKGGCTKVKVELPDEVATYLLNQKRAELVRLEKQYALKIQIIGQPGLPSHQYNLEFSRGESLPHSEKTPEKTTEIEGKVSPEEADRLAIEELKKETKESLLKKFFWPPSLWRGIRKSVPPPQPEVSPMEEQTESPAKIQERELKKGGE
ncbi:MAG: Rne/Rng family ribonuclease [Thermodesulfobacteriota bacterium]|nr:Rne/Rng family ribonuclease [Thermodesulfobacteriota bacterium]